MQKLTSDDGIIAIITLFVILLVLCVSARCTTPSLPPKDFIEQPKVAAALNEMYEAALPTFTDPSLLYEYYTTVEDDGTIALIRCSYEPGRAEVTITPHTTAILHTHPMLTSRQPSDQDDAIAAKYHIYNFVLSQYELWVAMPDGKPQRVGFVRLRHGQVNIEDFSLDNPLESVQ